MACILIVEDECLIAAALGLVLSEDGHQVCGVAATCADALAKAERFQPDLALVDVRLAFGSSGIEAVRGLRERHIPSIMLSAHAREDEARAAGAVGYLAKPYSVHTVLRAVREALDGQGGFLPGRQARAGAGMAG